MRSLLKLIPLFFIVVSFAFAGEPMKAENFTLPDYNGTKHSLTDYKDAKAVVVMFIATQCPVSNGYNTRMVSLYNDYKEKGVVFLGINSNKQESVEEVKEHAKEHGFEFTVLKDDKNVVADKFGATVTPEIYVISPSLDILYHGRIDDSRRELDVTTHDLRDALDAILAGKSVAVSETRAFGCTIKKVD
ncbi:MAG TPA: thioredoxin family protein [Bacteroidota bacterium]|nr:thioredoxin family protein [Bacteroidota bacterium]